MKIWDKELLDNYASKHSDIANALQKWVNIIEEISWKSHAELKFYFPTADYVGNNRYVFNIKGNNYRIVAVVVFISGILKIRFIGTHAEYSKINCKTI